MKPGTTGQVPVGMVKAPGVLHEKTATLHLADLYCLKEKPEMDVCFEGKTIDCIRVDGGADEGPKSFGGTIPMDRMASKRRKGTNISNNKEHWCQLLQPCRAAEWR